MSRLRPYTGVVNRAYAIEKRSGRILGLLLALLTGCDRAPVDPTRAAMARGAAWLWQRQGADGGWHSKEYGLLGSGQSLTPFVLHTLLQLPADVHTPPPDGVAKAIAFLERHVDEQGCLGLGDRLIVDYPNYATALAIVALREAGQRDELTRSMVAYLRDQQFTEERGWSPEHPAHGAFGMGGGPRVAPDHGHIDLSMTRHALMALATARDKALTERGLRFLSRCQNEDGGFVFSPVLPGANKAGRDGDGFRSYGSTTADGVLSLLALGVPPDDPRVSRAAAWLRDHHRVDRVPGFSDPTTGWTHGLRFYYLAASSRAFAALGIDEAPTGGSWREPLCNTLCSQQASDGYWSNWHSLVKEDEPLIATPLALLALTAAVGPRP